MALPNIDANTTEIEIDTTGGSFLEIVMIQLNKVVQCTVVEYRGGYYQKTEDKNGELVLVYVPDTRETFENALYSLVLLLKPKFYNDPKMKKAFEDYKVLMAAIEKEFLDRSSPDEEVILGEAFYDNTKDKIYLETYKNKKLKLHLKLFERLSSFLSRKNYFEMVGGIF